MRRLLVALLFLVLGAAPAVASPRDDLALLLGQARTYPEPAFAFFKVLSALPAATLSADDVRAAATKAGVPAATSLGRVLASVTRLEKKGTTVTITRSDTSPITLGEDEGVLWLAEQVKFQTRADANGETVDEVEGVRLSEKKDSTKGTLKKLRFELDKKSKKRVMLVTAGLGPFTSTETAPFEPRAAPTPGLVSGVESP